MYFDTHLHLVPAVDDGVRTVEEAVAVARQLVELGYGGGAVTPHIRPGRFENTPAGLAPATEALRRALAAEGVPFQVFDGAEHYFSPELGAALIEGEGRALGQPGGRHFLVELPTELPILGVPEWLFRLRLTGRVPVFAHPERCATFEDLELCGRLVDAGALLQLDLGSLAGAYGRGPRRLAEKLLAEDLYAVAGSDVHSLAQATRHLPKWIARLSKRAGSAKMDRLMHTHPRQILGLGPAEAQP